MSLDEISISFSLVAGNRQNLTQVRNVLREINKINDMLDLSEFGKDIKSIDFKDVLDKAGMEEVKQSVNDTMNMMKSIGRRIENIESVIGESESLIEMRAQLTTKMDNFQAAITDKLAEMVISIGMDIDSALDDKLSKLKSSIFGKISRETSKIPENVKDKLETEFDGVVSETLKLPDTIKEELQENFDKIAGMKVDIGEITKETAIALGDNFKEILSKSEEIPGNTADLINKNFDMIGEMRDKFQQDILNLMEKLQEMRNAMVEKEQARQVDADMFRKQLGSLWNSVNTVKETFESTTQVIKETVVDNPQLRQLGEVIDIFLVDYQESMKDVTSKFSESMSLFKSVIQDFQKYEKTDDIEKESEEKKKTREEFDLWRPTSERVEEIKQDSDRIMEFFDESMKFMDTKFKGMEDSERMLFEKFFKDIVSILKRTLSGGGTKDPEQLITQSDDRDEFMRGA